MSSSLFDSWGSDYESYPRTKHVEGDKTFMELKKGDILYCLKLKPNIEVLELPVTREWHGTKGHMYINANRRPINFGPANCANVSVDAPRNSICYHNMGILGTNKKSVINAEIEIIETEIENYRRKIKNALDELLECNAQIIKLKEI